MSTLPWIPQHHTDSSRCLFQHEAAYVLRASGNVISCAAVDANIRINSLQLDIASGMVPGLKQETREQGARGVPRVKYSPSTSLVQSKNIFDSV